MRKFLGVFAMGLALAGLAGPSFAADVVVRELNKGPEGLFVFDPAIVRIKPGDTVSFVAADKGHDVQSIAGMIPPGAEPFKGQMGQDQKVTFTKPGVYVYQCTPHLGLGMVGVVIVGAPANLNQIDISKLPPIAKKRLAGLLQDVKQTASR